MHKKTSMQRVLTSGHLWVMVLLIGGALLLQKVIGGSVVFLLAFLLVCPIMMIFMMRGHNYK